MCVLMIAFSNYANDAGGTLGHLTDIVIEIVTDSTNMLSSKSIQGTQTTPASSIATTTQVLGNSLEESLTIMIGVVMTSIVVTKVLTARRKHISD